MKWSFWKTGIFFFIEFLIFVTISTETSQFTNKLEISPKSCTVEVGGSEEDGICMFVWECIKSGGQHLGLCIDRFMFGSCCGHENPESNYLRPSTLFRPPSKPTSPNKLKTTKIPSNPNKYGTFSIQRPNGNLMLVIQKPFVSQYPLKIETTRQPSSTMSNVVGNFQNVFEVELQGASSVATGSWTSNSWKITTEPNFITKTTSPTKSKPTKKPIIYGSAFGNVTKKPTTFKPSKHPARPIPIAPPQTTLSPTTAPTTLGASTLNSLEVFENIIPTKSTPIRPMPGRVTVSASRSNECGVSFSRPETRIVGGKNAPFGRYPWQVSVRRTSFFGFSSTHRCGGAVLNENFVVTAAHCVDDLLTSQIRIRVGAHDFEKINLLLPHVERSVSKKIVHPKYNFYSYENDLALILMDQKLEFAPHISPICLPATDDLLVGENGILLGWGRLSEGGVLPSVLQEVSVPIVSNERCKSMFLKAGRHEFIPEIFLCAGHEKGQSDSCQGDSGGPLQVKGNDGHYFLAGIISWGIGCAEANLPGVCTRISKFQPWILENVS